MRRGLPSSAATPDAHRALVDRLVADAGPVPQLWPWPLRLALWSLLATTTFLGVALAAGLPDLTARMWEPLFASEVGALLLAALWTAALALRASVPGREPSPVELALVVAIVGGAVTLGLMQTPAPRIDDATFVPEGLYCAGCVMAIATVPWLVLLAAIRRGAPLTVRLAGTLAGAAALLLACATTRIACPLSDERWHLLVWHILPVAPGAALSAILGSIWLPRWRQPRDLAKGMG
jgi:hypothetical protein